MKRTFTLFGFLLQLTLALASSEIANMQSAVGSLPPTFIENRGQWDEQVLFRLELNRVVWFLERDGLTLVSLQKSIPPALPERVTDPIARKLFEDFLDTAQIRYHALKFQFHNSSTSGQPRPIEPVPQNAIETRGAQEWRTNFLVGNDPKKWGTDCQSYTSVLYREVWKGIDIEWYTKDGQLEFDFIVRPGADPEQIGIECTGLTDGAIMTTEGGALVIPTSLGSVRAILPAVYQTDQYDNRRELSTHWQITGNRYLTIASPKQYEPDEELRIDPLVFCTFTYPDSAINYWETASVTTSTEGYCILGGTADNVTFPLTIGAYSTTMRGVKDWLISKMGPNHLVYMTYIGGNQEDNISTSVYFYDHTNPIISDGFGGAVIAGRTISNDFPVTIPGGIAGGYDGAIVHLNSGGTQLLMGRYFGGSLYDGIDHIVTDGSGGFVIVGNTQSENLPTTVNAFQQNRLIDPNELPVPNEIFIARMNNSGVVSYCSYFGGSLNDYVCDVAADGSGGIHIAGQTESRDFPITANAYAFNWHFSAEVMFFYTHLSTTQSSLLFSSYAGDLVGYSFLRPWWASINGICSDGNGGAYILGEGRWLQFSPDAYDSTFRSTSNLVSDSFVQHFNSSGQMVYCSLTGNGHEALIGIRSLDIKSDNAGGFWFCGHARESYYPTTPDALYTTFQGGDGDLVLSHFNPDNRLVYSTYFGGTGEELGSLGWGPKIDTDGNTSVFISGNSESWNTLPFTNAMFTTYGDHSRAAPFVARFDAIWVEIDYPHRPTYSDTLIIGTNVPFYLSAFGSTSTVSLYINRNYPNGSWSPWITNATANREYLFQVSGPETNNARFKLVLDSNPNTFVITPTNTTILAPRLAISHPNGSDTLYSLTADTIRWTSTNLTGNVTIRLNTNYPSGSWTTLNGSPVAVTAGSFVWTPNVLSSRTHCRIAIVPDNPLLADTSGNDFSILVRSFTITRPNTTDTSWVLLEDTLRWSSNYRMNVSIRLSRHGMDTNSLEMHYDNLHIEPGVGSVSWSPTAPTTDSARFLVTNLESGQQFWSQQFYVRRKPLTLSTFTGGEIKYRLVADTIRYSFPESTERVNIEWKQNYPSGSWSSISTNAVNTGWCAWTIPDISTEHARVRVTTTDHAWGDTSNTDISFRNPWQLVSPNGGELLTVGTVTTVRWQSQVTGLPLILKINRNYPSGNWEEICNILVSTGSTRSWTVTGPGGSNCRMAIQLGSTLRDTSDANFTIVGLGVMSTVASVDYNTATMGTSYSRAITITNVGGNLPISTNSIHFTGPFNGASAISNLLPGNSINYQITWHVAGGDTSNDGSVVFRYNTTDSCIVQLHGEESFRPPYVMNYSRVEGQFPPRWGRFNPDSVGHPTQTWLTTGSGLSQEFVITNETISAAVGKLDYLITPRFDLRSVTNSTVLFQFEYSYYAASGSDTLRVDLSNDNGATYQLGYFHRGGTALQNHTNPNAAGAWSIVSVVIPTVWYDDGDAVRVRLVNITGHGGTLHIKSPKLLAAGSIVSRPLLLDFGSIPSATDTSQVLWIRNTSGVAVLIDSMRLPTNYTASWSSFPRSLPAGDSTAVSIRYAPGATGYHADYLHVFTSPSTTHDYKIWTSGRSIRNIASYSQDAPQNLRISSTPPNKTLTWDSAAGASLYRLYRSDSAYFTPNGFSTLVANTPLLSATDTTSNPNGFYRVTAFSGFLPVWSRQYSTGTTNEQFFAVTETFDGGAVAVGGNNFLNINSQLFVVRTNYNGDTLWSRVYPAYGFGSSVLQLADSTLIIAGYIGYGASLFVVQLDLNGAILNQYVASTSLNGFLFKFGIIQTHDGGFLIACARSTDAMMIKLNATLTQQWLRLYSLSTSGQDMFTGVYQLPDNGFLACGMLQNSGSFALRTDSLGTQVWLRSYGYSTNDMFNDIIHLPDDSYLMVGMRGFQPWMARIRDTGDTVSSAYLPGGTTKYCSKGLWTKDGNYVFSVCNAMENSNGDIQLYKITPSNVTIWSRTFDSGGDDAVRCIYPTSVGGFLIGGGYRSFNTNAQGDGWMIRTDQAGSATIPY
ncbi:MAG: hypothetical protein OEM52_09125 [bacterium]|nr:hypothetical protein [bacterium]